MHWLEKWQRERCAVKDRGGCEDCRYLCKPQVELARGAQVPLRLIDRLIYEGWITHPNFADRIADFTGATAKQRDKLVHKKHRGTYVPGKALKKIKRPRPEPDRSGKGWIGRPVVAIDREGKVLHSFDTALQAAESAGYGTAYIYARCEHRLSSARDEFRSKGLSYRWTDEWQAMSREEQLEDVRRASEKEETQVKNITVVPRTYKCLGQSHTLAEWARIADIPLETLSKRLKLGWDMERAIRTPVRSYICTGEIEDSASSTELDFDKIRAGWSR